MKLTALLFITFSIIISCSNNTNTKIAEITENDNSQSVNNDNIVHDMSLEDAVNKYNDMPSIDIIKDLIASGDINSTLTFSTNIVNTEDTEYDLSITFDEGTTALMIASYYGYDDLVNALVKNGADVNKKNSRNYTALLYAADIWSRQGIGIDNSNFNTVEILVMNKADINAVNKYGWSPLFFAAENSNSDVAAFLVDNGADINLTADEGVTPLILANDAEAVKILANTENINKPNDYGVTPLISFSRRGISLEAVKILLEKGADINFVNKDGYTALSESIENYNFEIALLLLENNADPNAGSKKAKELAEISREFGNEETALILDKYIN